MMKLLVAIAFPILLASSPLPARDAAGLRTPEATATAYMQKIKKDGLGTVGQLMHPEELEKFKKMMAPVIESDGAEALGEMFSGFEGKNIGEMSGIEFMNAFLAGIAVMMPQLEEIMKSAEMNPLGHVKEGDVAHVVVRVRMEVDGLKVEQMQVLSVKDHDGVPKMLLSGELKGVAEALKRLDGSE